MLRTLPALLTILMIVFTPKVEGQKLDKLSSLKLIASMEHLPIDMKPSHYRDANYFAGYSSTSSLWIGFLCKINSKGDTVWTWHNSSTFNSGNAGLMPRSICLDKYDNITMVGYYNLPSTSDSINIGRYRLSASPYGLGSFIAKFDSSGKVLYAKGYSGYVNFNDVDLDDKGNAYIIGNTQIAYTLGSYSIPKPVLLSGGTNSRDFLFSIDSAGSVRWAKPLGCLDLGRAIAGNEGGLNRISLSKGSNPRIFVSGFYLDSFVFGGNKFTSNGREDGLVVKFDLNGNYMASRSMGGSNMDALYDVSINNNNTISLAGMYKSSTSINGKSYSVSACQALVMQMDTSLNFQWLDTAGLGCGNYPHLSIDNYSRTCLVSGANASNFLFFYDNNGKRVFTKSYTLNGSTSFGGLAPFAVTFPEKAPSTMYVIGAYKPSITSDSKTISCVTSSLRDIALFKYDVPLPCTPKLGNDTGFCGNFTLALDPKVSNGKYLWSTNDTSNKITINQMGKYWVNVTKDGCSSTDTILIFHDTTKPVFVPLHDTFSCGIYNPQLTVPSNSARKFRWWNNSTQKTVWGPYDGIAWIQYDNYCGSVRDTLGIIHQELPKPFLGNDTTICSYDHLSLFAGDSSSHFIWSTNDSAYSISVNKAGQYWVKVNNFCGSGTDTIKIGVTDNPAVELPTDTFFCGMTKIQITGKTTNATSIKWSSGEITTSIKVSSQGKYVLKAMNICGNAYDTIQIANYPLPLVALPNDTFLCNNQAITIHASSNAPIIWSTTDTGTDVLIGKSGMYYVSGVNACGMASDTIVVSSILKPDPNLGNDTLFCGNSFVLNLNARTSADKYAWSNGSMDSVTAITSPGKVWVTASNRCGVKSDTMQIQNKNRPSVNLGQDTIAPKMFSIKLDAGNPGCTYQWSSNDTSRYLTVSKPGTYWVVVSNECGVATDSIDISLRSGVHTNTKPIYRVYPNPFNDVIVLDLPSNKQVSNISVVNQLGQELVQISKTILGENNILDLSVLNPGTYILHLNFSDGSASSVLIIKNTL